MRILVDISQLHPDALKRGVGFYSLNLFQSLSGLQDKNQYILNKDQHGQIKADLVHYPYFDPFFLTLPRQGSFKTVVTVHDLIPLKFPQHYPSGLRGQIKWYLQKARLKKVDAIITDSQNSKNDIVEIIGCSSEKIFPIYLAAGKEFKKLESKKVRNEDIKGKYKLPEKFILYVGDLNWNKNVKSLVKAFNKIKDQRSKITRPRPSRDEVGKITDQNLKLVLVGKAFEDDHLPQLKRLKQLIQKLKIKDDVKMLGFVPIKDLAVIYNQATLYVQSSFYEGFGLPVLEAMGCGCPVLSSNQASLSEVGGQAVEYFDPYKKNDLENKISSLLKNKKKLKLLSKQGLMQARKFSWEKTALATREVYEKIHKADKKTS